jgi:hypothetical protein
VDGPGGPMPLMINVEEQDALSGTAERRMIYFSAFCRAPRRIETEDR